MHGRRIEIESESSGLKSLQAAQICRVSAKEPSRYPLLNYRVHDAMVLVDKVEFNRGTVNRETTPWNTGKNSKLSKYWIISLRYIPARITEERIVPKRKRKKTTLSLFVTIGKILKERWYTEKNRVQLISRDIKESGSREDRIETVFVEIILLIEPTRYKYTYNRNRLRTKSTNCYPHPLFDIQVRVLSRLLFSLHFVGGFARYSTRAEREKGWPTREAGSSIFVSSRSTDRSTAFQQCR